MWLANTNPRTNFSLTGIRLISDLLCSILDYLFGEAMISNEYHGKNDQSGNKDVGYEKEIFPAGKGISCRSPENEQDAGLLYAE